MEKVKLSLLNGLITYTELDVNIVKALAYKESRLAQGGSESTKASDIFSMFNVKDYGDKGKIGLTLETVRRHSD